MALMKVPIIYKINNYYINKFVNLKEIVNEKNKKNHFLKVKINQVIIFIIKLINKKI